jgi:hypothetical protein
MTAPTPEPMSGAAIEAARLVARLAFEAVLIAAGFFALGFSLVIIAALCAGPIGA